MINLNPEQIAELPEQIKWLQNTIGTYYIQEVDILKRAIFVLEDAETAINQLSKQVASMGRAAKGYRESILSQHEQKNALQAKLDEIELFIKQADRLAPSRLCDVIARKATEIERAELKRANGQ